MTVRPFDFAKDANTIAKFYAQEWNIPQDKTIQNLKSTNVIFQLVILIDDQIIATGGVHRKVGIHLKGDYSTKDPWLALMYVQPSHRRKGIGAQLLAEIENYSIQIGFKKLCLFTKDQQGFYLHCKWRLDEKLTLRDQLIYLMHKSFN